jgi:hypothetical protein
MPSPPNPVRVPSRNDRSASSVEMKVCRADILQAPSRNSAARRPFGTTRLSSDWLRALIIVADGTVRVPPEFSGSGRQLRVAVRGARPDYPPAGAPWPAC